MMVIVSAPERYPDLIQLGTLTSILTLLTHENPDIALACIELLNEMTGDEVVREEGPEEQEEAVHVFVDAFVKEQGLKAVVDNLDRLEEGKDDDAKGIFTIMSLIENVVSVNPQIANVVGKDTKILHYLINRFTTKGMDTNKQYASEILSILLQDSQANRLALVKLGGVDNLLESVARYKKKDPTDEDEMEMVENLFASLCSITVEPAARQAFVNGQGFELMMIMLGEKKLSRFRALKVVDYCLTGNDESCKKACAYWTQNGGVDGIMDILLRRGTKHMKKYKAFSELEEAGMFIVRGSPANNRQERVISIIYSMLRNLDEPRLVLERFDEEACKRLMDLWNMFSKRLARTEKEIETQMEELELDEDDVLMQRLAGGLLSLQQTAFIMAHLLSDGSIRECLVPSLQVTMDDIQQQLDNFASNLGDDHERQALKKLAQSLHEI